MTPAPAAHDHGAVHLLAQSAAKSDGRAGVGILVRYETASAGLAVDTDNVLDGEQIDWADITLVMEAVHQRRLKLRFGRHLRSKNVICLDIPDHFMLMQPELVELLVAKAGHFLRRELM